MASNDLVWLLVKNNNRFLVKRNGAEFSREPQNLMNLNSYKFSGLANNKTVGVQVSADGKSPALVVNRSQKADSTRHPATKSVSIPLKRHMRNHSCRAARTVKSLTTGSFYRRDLTNFAVARYHAVRATLAPKKTIAKKERRRHKVAKVAA